MTLFFFLQKTRHNYHKYGFHKKLTIGDHYRGGRILIHFYEEHLLVNFFYMTNAHENDIIKLTQNCPNSIVYFLRMTFTSHKCACFYVRDLAIYAYLNIFEVDFFFLCYNFHYQPQLHNSITTQNVHHHLTRAIAYLKLGKKIIMTSLPSESIRYLRIFFSQSS